MEKKYKNGLVLGKFLPFSLGHKFLIDSAIKRCEIVHVMVCSLKREPIPGLYRYEWVRDSYMDNPNVNVIWCEDELPQKTYECESVDVFYKNNWIPAIYSRIEKLDSVFTSEEYGDEFAEYLGVDHILIDLYRETVPVSGSSIRKNPYKRWEYIPDIVKPYYSQKVVIMGPESTGKSILSKKLSQYFNCGYIEEYGRTYSETVKPAKEFTQKDFEIIAQKHYDLVKSQSTNKLTIVDTEAITTKIFGEMYIDDFNPEKINDIIDKQKFNLYLLLNVDVPWIDDGNRDFPTERETHYNRIKKELLERKLPFIEINGESYDDRFNESVNVIKSILNTI